MLFALVAVLGFTLGKNDDRWLATWGGAGVGIILGLTILTLVPVMPFTEQEAASAAELARALPAEILRGDYEEGALMPSRLTLKGELGVSAETASVALRMLAAEGLIRLEQGKRSVVLPVRAYGTEVVVPFKEKISDEVHARAKRRVRVQADDDPSIGETLAVANAGERLRIWLAVTAADSGRAAARAMAVVVYACPAADGWDLAGASVTARPA